MQIVLEIARAGVQGASARVKHARSTNDKQLGYASHHEKQDDSVVTYFGLRSIDERIAVGAFISYNTKKQPTHKQYRQRNLTLGSSSIEYHCDKWDTPKITRHEVV
jgi:hypothetical protein